jgi:hypothetical protein
MSILPPIPPPLLPLRTVKLGLSQLHIHRIMRPAHPKPKHILAFHPRRIARLRHPISKVVGAHPARVKLREEGEELLRFRLECRWGGVGVGGCEGMEEGPGAAAEYVDVGRAVRIYQRRGWYGGGGRGR